jgi:hypothetical protein
LFPSTWILSKTIGEKPVASVPSLASVTGGDRRIDVPADKINIISSYRTEFSGFLGFLMFRLLG